jgi:hypothetical protein
MDQATLVEVDLKKSERIVAALDAAGVRVAVAIWVQLPEYGDWRLALASKDLDPLFLLKAYSKVGRALDKAGLTVRETPTIHLMKTTDPLIRALRKSLGKAEGIVGMRIGGRPWGGRYIDDGYAYKIA